MRFKCINLIIIFCYFFGAEAVGQAPWQRLRACMMSRVISQAGYMVVSRAKNLATAGSEWVQHHKRYLVLGGVRRMVRGYVWSKFFGGGVVNNQAAEVGIARSGAGWPDFIAESLLLTGLYTLQTAGYVSAGVAEVEKLPEDRSFLNKVKAFSRAICRDFGTDVIHGVTMPRLSEFDILSHVPCPFLMRCFIAGIWSNIVHAGLQHWFVRPCMRFGAYARRFTQHVGVKDICCPETAAFLRPRQ